MQKPKKLVVGDTIALVTPSGMPPERFRHYIPLIEKYILDEGFQTKTYLAPDNSSDEQLADIFSQAWMDKNVKAVFPICGSERIYEVIKHIKCDILTQKAVIFCGSSVLSALSIFISQKVNIMTFFGPHISFIHLKAPQRENQFTIQSFWGMLMWKTGRTKMINSTHERCHFFRVNPQEENVHISNIYNKSEMITDLRRRDVFFLSSNSGTIEGRIVCITLASLLKMSRQNILTSLSDHILFVETMDWRIEDVLNALIEVSKYSFFHGILGICITALTERTDRVIPLFKELRDKSKIGTLCLDLSQKIGIPVWYGFPIGHCAYKLTLPQGVKCKVNLNDGSLFITEKPFI